MDFKDAKSSVLSAVRYGMTAQFNWKGKLISSQCLIVDELLSMAYWGLYKRGVFPRDAENYLTVIENRVNMHKGAEWLKKSYRNLLERKKPIEALQVLTANMYL